MFLERPFTVFNTIPRKTPIRNDWVWVVNHGERCGTRNNLLTSEAEGRLLRWSRWEVRVATFSEPSIEL